MKLKEKGRRRERGGREGRRRASNTHKKLFYLINLITSRNVSNQTDTYEILSAEMFSVDLHIRGKLDTTLYPKIMRAPFCVGE